MAGIDDIDNLGTAARNAAGDLNDLQRASQAVTDAEKLQAQRSKELRDAFKNLYESTNRLNGGFSKYSDAITFGMGKLGGVLESFGESVGLSTDKISRVLGATVRGMGKVLSSTTDLAKSALDQHDNLVKAYRGLSEFGAIDSSGIEGLQNTLADIGASADNVQYFTEALSKAAPELATFGGTVAGGAKSVTKVVKGLLYDAGEFEGKLTQFGYSTEDVMKYATTSIALNSRNMQGLNKDTGALQKTTYEYMKDLAELAELTGNSRDQQVATQKQLQTDFNFRLKLQQMAESGPDGQRQADRAQAFMRNLEMMNPALARTIRDIDLHGGATSAETAQKAGQYRETIKEYQRAVKSGEEVQVAFSKIGQIARDEAVVGIRKLGYAASFGAESQQALQMTYHDINLAQNKDWKAASDAVKKNTDSMEAQLDPRLRAETERQKRERMIVNTFQDVFFALGDKAVKSVNAFLSSITGATKGIVDATEKLTGKKLTNRFEGEKYLTSNENIAALQEERTYLQKRIKEFEEDKLRHQRENNSVLERIDDAKIEGAKKDLENFNKKLSREKANRENLSNEAAKARAMEDSKNFSMKSGLQWNKEGMNPVAMDLMSRIQQLPKFKQFTSANEPYFERDNPNGKFYNPNSLHPKGQAFDFTYDKDKVSPADLAQLKQLIKEFQQTTHSTIQMQDAYNNKIKGEAPHIHIEVIPNSNGSGAAVSGKVSSNSMDTAPKLSLNDVPSTKNNTSTSYVPQSNTTDSSVVVSKLDELRTLFDRSLRVQEDILAYTKLA